MFPTYQKLENTWRSILFPTEMPINIKTAIVGKLHANTDPKNVKEISNSHACFITLMASKILMLKQYIVLRALVISLMMKM